MLRNFISRLLGGAGGDEEEVENPRCECGYPQPDSAWGAEDAEEVGLDWELEGVTEHPGSVVRTYRRVVRYRCHVCQEEFGHTLSITQQDVEWKDVEDTPDLEGMENVPDPGGEGDE